MKQINPTHWTLEDHPSGPCSPLVSFVNDRKHRFHIHPVDARLVRVVHSLPKSEQGAQATLGGVPLRNHHSSTHIGLDGFHWERRTAEWTRSVDEERKSVELRCDVGHGVGVFVLVDYASTITLTWCWFEGGIEKRFAFLRDFKTAYKYDARSKRVFHIVCRDQSYVATTEHARPANENHVPQPNRFEYVYGLGECKGPMMKDGKRYVMEARDSLGADPQETDPLYKIIPYYLHYNSKSRFWFGLYYNTLVPSVFDFSGEHDFATGQFRSFSAERGPLDYYVLLGDVQAHQTHQRPCPASIVSQLARLVTPASFGHAGRRQTDDGLLGWQTSPCLPPHNQFGYLASSLTLSERPDAQQAVTEYIVDARNNGFPLDSMHLSSGYCVDSDTGNRNYFFWDKHKYPDPHWFGTTMENDLACTVIINVKPWLLESHPYYEDAAREGAFVRAASDAYHDDDRCAAFETAPSRTLHWARGMGDTSQGSYIDFSSVSGTDKWNWMMVKGVLSNGITGLWIDNNEFNSIIDDEDEVQGTIHLWSLPELPGDWSWSQVDDNTEQAMDVRDRLGWVGGQIAIGAVGAATLTMGMARATFASLLSHRPNHRPVVVTRSAVPGMQAFAHSTWSGDNSTTWLSLKWSTKMSLSVGLSFGLGLYGHDVGGFAGEHSPSAELLVRWCQQSMWMTRFTIHSWKPITTTPWMYDERVTDIIRKTIAFRYRLLPTLYSLYVTQYHRHGWPVVRPLLWHHAQHLECLVQDEQFLVGSHILVAPVCDAGITQSTFFLPHRSEDDDGIEIDDTCWYEIDTGRVHRPSSTGNQVTLDAPLHRCPTLIREGGIYVSGPNQLTNIPSPGPLQRTYTAHIFPTPFEQPRQGSSRPSRHSKGHFILFDDDGTTNEATGRGRFTEMKLFFRQPLGSDGPLEGQAVVEVGIEIIRASYAAKWDISFTLPKNDARQLRSVDHQSHHLWAQNVRIEEPGDRPGHFIIIVEPEGDDGAK